MLMETQQRLCLTRPKLLSWRHFLVKSFPDLSSASDADPLDDELLPSPTVPLMDAQMGFLARLKQPFGALLLVPTRRNVPEYRRIATENPIMTQVQEITPATLSRLIVYGCWMCFDKIITFFFLRESALPPRDFTTSDTTRCRSSLGRCALSMGSACGQLRCNCVLVYELYERISKMTAFFIRLAATKI